MRNAVNGESLFLHRCSVIFRFHTNRDYEIIETEINDNPDLPVSLICTILALMLTILIDSSNFTKNCGTEFFELISEDYKVRFFDLGQRMSNILSIHS